MQQLNLLLFNQTHGDTEELERKFMDAFADFNQEFLWKFEGLSLICLKLERAKAIAIVKKIWSQYAFIFYKTLTSGSKRESISVLYALIQMGNLSAVIANDLIQNFNFNLKLKTSWTISRKKCTHIQYPYEEYIKDYDTRSLFILFICTLLRKSEVHVRQKFTVQAKGVIGQVFVGLEKDTEYIQKVFLETLRKYVIDPDAIQKNIKISILQVRNLDKIAVLNNSVSLDFLKHVCTRPGYGVCYEDMGWYPPDKEKILSDFIPGLKVLKIEVHKELLLEILKNCPELVKGYVCKLHILPIDQFLHPAWDDAIKVLTDIVNLPIPKNFGALMYLPPPVSGFIDSIIPTCFTSNISTKGLQHSLSSIKIKIAAFLCVGLSKLERVVEGLLERRNATNVDEWSECIDELLLQVQKRIPTWQLVVSFHHFCISDESEGHLELKQLAYKLVLFYQKFFSKTIEESKFNYGKLIIGNMHTLPSDIQFLFLEILGNVKEFKWWMVSENGASHFKKLLIYFVSCKNREMKDVALRSLVSCMSKSILFCENSDYLYILLSVLKFSSKFHHEAIIFFLDRALCDSEKSSARLSSMRAGFESFKLKLHGETYSDGPYFCLYWLIESFKRMIHLKEINVESIVLFFSRLVSEQLYSFGETGEALFLFGSILMNALSDFHSENFLKLFDNALNIVRLSSQVEKKIINVFSRDRRNNSTGIFEKASGLKELDLSNIVEQYSPQEILFMATKRDLNLSPEMIHETVCALCLYHPANVMREDSKLNPMILHFLPVSYLFEYSIHTYDMNSILSIIKDLLEKRVLRFIFRHAILYLTRLHHSTDVERFNLCGSVVISVIERAIRLNCIQEIISCKAYQTLLLNAFNDGIYLKVVEKDIFTVCILQIASKLLQIQSDDLHNSLIGPLSVLKTSFIKNFNSCFPKIADIEFLNIFKHVRKAEILLELLDSAYSTLDFDQFCDIVDHILMPNTSNNLYGRYLPFIVQNCGANFSEKSFYLIEKILSLSKAEFGNCNLTIILSQYCNDFGSSLMILPEDLAKEFIPILATKISPKVRCTVQYFVEFYPRLRKLFLNRINDERLEIDEIMFLLECFMGSCCTVGISCNWKAFVEDEVKLSLNRLWGSIQDLILNEIKESLFGRKEYDKRIFFVFKRCTHLFGISTGFLEEVMTGITTMSCNTITMKVLVDILPQLCSLGDIAKRKSIVLVILLRIFRGYLIFMKDKEVTLDIISIANEIIALSKDINILEQVHDDDEKELMKYISNFVITSLKSYFENYILASCVVSLWNVCFKSKFNLLPGDKLLDMVITHSKFHGVMVSHDIKFGRIQYELAQLIRIVMETSPSQFCTVPYLEKIASIYYGTVKASDRVLLSIFGLFEKRLGISALRWIHNNWINKGHGDILHSLDNSKMIQTLADFPVNQNMEDILNDDFKVACFDESDYYLYDISFLIPFAASLLFEPAHTVDLSLFIKSNLLGIVTMGLSSTSEQTRRGASSVLVKFYELLDTSDLKERIFLVILFDSLKNSIVCDTNIPPRIPSIITYFVAQSSIILVNSESLMYPLINRFLLQRPTLDLKDIPMFYECIYSSSEFNRYERVWLLKLLSCGILNDDDYGIMKRRHAIDILFGLYCSSICDSQMKLTILEILYKSSKQYGITKSIIMRSSILTFFHSVCLKADFSVLEENTLCIPSILASYGKMSLLMESKSCYNSSLSSIITTMSFYLRRLVDAFPNIKNKRMGYGALSHILKLYQELACSSKYETILGIEDIMNVISIVDLYEGGHEDIISEKVVTPSRIHIEKILPTEYRGTKIDLQSMMVKWIFSAAVLSLDNPRFICILSWAGDVSVKKVALYNEFGKWIISCRLSNQNHSFRSIYQSAEWKSFLKNLFVICHTTKELCFSIYSSLMLLILRDLDYMDPDVTRLVSEVPSPRQILESFTADDSNFEMVFDQLRKILWSPSGILSYD